MSGSRKKRYAILGLLAVVLAACGSAIVRHRRTRTDDGHALTDSNVLRRDYAGSTSCAPCHAEIYRQWEHSPMHRMTRVTGTAEIRAPFDGSEFRFGSDSVRVSQIGNERFIHLVSAGRPDASFRITRVIGGRYREDFAGVAVDGIGPDAHVLGDAHAEMIMPVSWVFATRSWRYKGYSVMVRERPGMRAGPEWRSSCIFCHNTVPYLDTVFGELYGPGAPAYQGTAQDRLLPPSRLFHAEITDHDGLATAAMEETEFVRGHQSSDPADSDRAALGNAIRTSREHFNASHLLEVGIGCETCHNGSREHAQHPEVRPTFEVRSPLFEMRPARGRPDANRAQWITRTCLRCHTVLFSHYPYTWEGGLRLGPSPGGSHINSGEARDFLLGGCSSQMSCAECHDPHTEDTADTLHQLETPAGNSTCTACHARYATNAALAAHSHHTPGGAGAVCINCHMPRKNMGLNYMLTRYHRIGSPTETVRVEHDRPLECALCHVDRSVASLVENMEQWWGHSYDRAALRTLYGADLNVRPLQWTALHGLPHEAAVAVSVLGREHVREALPLIASQLGNDYPLVRYFALRAMEEAAGTEIPLDMNAEGTAIVAQARAWIAAHP